MNTPPPFTAPLLPAPTPEELQATVRLALGGTDEALLRLRQLLERTAYRDDAFHHITEATNGMNLALRAIYDFVEHSRPVT